MKILITNDDGIGSAFLGELASCLSPHHEVSVVAPAHEQSGIGQAITLHSTITFKQLADRPYTAFSVSGTPSDCVKLAVCHIFPHTQFDLVVSGINTCENAGLSTIYSGTVAGAREGASWGIPSISLSVWDSAPWRSEYAASWLLGILVREGILNFGPGIFWNVNFPKCSPEEISGVHISKMSGAMFEDCYETCIGPSGAAELQLTGEKRKDQMVPGSDDWALRQNKISITPLKIDQTSKEEAFRLTQLFNDANTKSNSSPKTEIKTEINTKTIPAST